jgi:N-acetylmuramoyl-L-alanine amidase
MIKQVGAAVATALYTGRNPGYDRVAWVRAGEQFTYLDSAEGWFKVRSAAGNIGWIDGSKVYVWDKNMEFSFQAAYSVIEGDWRMQFDKARQVVQGVTALPIRSGSAATSPVIGTLRSGERFKLRYVGTGEYVQITLANGVPAWISRNWLQPVPGVPQEAFRLQQMGPGFLRLELSNQAARANVSSSGNYLQFSLPDNAARLAGLSVQEYGVAEMTMDRNSTTVRFDSPVQYRVVEQTDQRTVVEIRTGVSKIQAIPGNDRQTYRFFVDGSVTPTARREGGSVVMDLPGTMLQAGQAAPPGLTLSQGSGLTARVTTNQQYEMKRGAGFFDLVIYQPGLAGKVIVVDPGHGGSEIGAIGPTGLQEQTSNLAMGLKLRDMLQAAGATVLMTRTGDTRCATPAELAGVPLSQQLHYDLNCRAQLSNRKAADLFVSIHGNANPSRAEQGTETYYAAENFNVAQSRELATFVQAQVPPALDTKNRGVKVMDFYVVKYTEAPAILVETAFLSNPWEEKMLKTDAYRAKAAAAIFRGIQGYWK